MKHAIFLAAIFTATTLSFFTSSGQPSLTKIDINPTGSSSPEMLTTALNKLYFYADNGVAGKELMNYDGTNVNLVADLVPGSGGLTALSNICELNGKIYFAAPDVAGGVELFVYDGINPPAMVKDVVAGGTSSMPSDLVAFNSRLYFRAGISLTNTDYGIYCYDPMVGSLQMIASGPKPNQGTELFAFNNKLCFSAQVSLLQGANGDGLYNYDPVSGLIDTIMDIDPGLGRPFGYEVSNGNLYFAYATYVDGFELFKYDGISQPQMLTNFPGTQGIVYRSDLMKMGNRIFMYLTGVGNSKRILAAYDETATSSIMLDTATYLGAGFGIYNNRMYLCHDNGPEFPIYTYDGLNFRLLSDFVTAAQSVAVADDYQVYQGDLFFSAYVPNVDRELYKFNDANMSIGNVQQLFATVYPNPATTEATISFTLKQSTKLNVQLTDMQGRVVYAATKKCAPGNNELTVPMQQLAAGIYIYSLLGETGELLGKGKVTKQ